MSTPTNTDYNGLFEALRNFQRGDSRFKDFDFEASGINSIIKLLAANTSSAALSTHFALNESFISTSEILENVQALVTPQTGYIPFGKKSSLMVCDVVVIPEDVNMAPATLQIPKTFNAVGLGDGKTLTFTPKNSYSAALSDGVYTFPSVLMVEGQRVASSFTQQGTGIIEFEIPNKDIDISTLEVSVRNSINDRTTEIYTRFDSAYQLGAESKLFFLSMNRNGKYKIEFGDGIISKALTSGNIIYANYVVSNGVDGNGVEKLTPTSEIKGFSNITISPISKSKGGAEPEPISVIQSKAKISKGMGGVASSNEEYELKLGELLPAYKVKAWSGDEANPPRPGFVLFTTFPLISEAEQQDVKLILDKYSVGSVLTSYASYQTYEVKVKVFYVTSGSSSSKERIEKELNTKIIKFSEDLTNFGGYFEPRELENIIETLDQIDRVYVSYEMQSPVEVSASSFSFDYHRQIRSGSFEAHFSGDETFDTIKDTGEGFFKFKNGIIGDQVSTSFDYENGRVTVSNIDTNIVSCNGNTSSPSGDDLFLQTEPFELLLVRLGEVETL